MKLKSFQIKNYKVIDDTKPVPVDPDATALVIAEADFGERIA